MNKNRLRKSVPAVKPNRTRENKTFEMKSKIVLHRFTNKLLDYPKFGFQIFWNLPVGGIVDRFRPEHLFLTNFTDHNLISIK